MAFEPEAPLDALWRQYGSVFREWDDLTLGRWLAQTLGQLEGRAWRLSHPLVGSYRLAAQVANEKQIWHQRVVNIPAGYTESPCCRAPFLPLVTRDVHTEGLICQHCNEVLVAPDDIPENLRTELDFWAKQYAPIHAVAHWEDRQRRKAGNYDDAFEKAAQEAEKFLLQLGTVIAPRLLESYPAVIWEDQDECLEVRPEDVRL
jgi:uncharacterized protein YbaR (Trm112 family)